MFSERKKTALILFLAVSALSIVILFLLFPRFYRSFFGKLLFDIGLTRWGWIPALVLATRQFSTIRIRDTNFGNSTYLFILLGLFDTSFCALKTLGDITYESEQKRKVASQRCPIGLLYSSARLFR